MGLIWAVDSQRGPEMILLGQFHGDRGGIMRALGFHVDRGDAGKKMSQDVDWRGQGLAGIACEVLCFQGLSRSTDR